MIDVLLTRRVALCGRTGGGWHRGYCNSMRPIVALSDSEHLMRLYQHISAEFLAFGRLADKEMLHSPYVEKNAGMIFLLKAGENATPLPPLKPT
ncbi:hypothetical protein ACVXG7_25595 [Enterobacter hormaechei]